MGLSNHKTKIVCTIGPASGEQAIMGQMLHAGMTVARLNFSHGNLAGHARVIERLRAASKATGRRLAIMGDLPGPKMRIGDFTGNEIILEKGADFIVTTDDIAGDAGRVSVSFKTLATVVKPGTAIFLNDGFIKLEVVKVVGNDVHCTVVVGGPLSARKGLNVPGIDLGISAFTAEDRSCLVFAHEQGLDAISQSFVESAADIRAVRAAATQLGYTPFIIAKIERAGALENIDEIIQAADGIMIARGDLGVEIPIETIAITQKQLIDKATLQSKPVITATQMLESMTRHSLPTRAEATDVANAILDGTDAVMLSAESAVGDYPVEATAMLTRIAAATEPNREPYRLEEALRTYGRGEEAMALNDLITLSVETCLSRVNPAMILVPTLSGASARNIARFRPNAWVIAVSPDAATCQAMQFSYGVYPVYETEYQTAWKQYARKVCAQLGSNGKLVILMEGPSSTHPDDNHRMELIDLAE